MTEKEKGQNPHGPIKVWVCENCTREWGTYEGEFPQSWTKIGENKALCPLCAHTSVAAMKRGKAGAGRGTRDPDDEDED